VPRLVAREGENAGAEWRLTAGKPRAVVGRAGGCEVRLSDSKASRAHAEIILDGERILLRDLRSRNGTQLNGRDCEETEELEFGDRIRIGDTVLELVDDAPAGRAPVEIPGYEIVSTLGRGATGSVYKARQLSMDRIVALRVIDEVYARDPGFGRLLAREARAAGKLSHPNVVQLHDVNRTDGIQYVSAEYVEGSSVKRMIRERGRLEPGEALEMILQAAKALEYVHGQGVVHEDVKPGNLLVAAGGTVKLADAALSRAFRESGMEAPRRGAFGTPHYMAPEQILEGKPDVRTDIYSLGATFYHMLTGEVPFRGETVNDILMAHINDSLPAVQEIEPDVPDGVVFIVERMMARRPEDRYPQARSLIGDLEKAKAPGPSAALEHIAEGRSSVAAATPAARARGVKRKLARRGGEARRRKAQAPAGGGAKGVTVLLAILVPAVLFMVTIGLAGAFRRGPGGEVAGRRTGAADERRPGGPGSEAAGSRYEDVVLDDMRHGPAAGTPRNRPLTPEEIERLRAERSGGTEARPPGPRPPRDEGRAQGRSEGGAAARRPQQAASRPGLRDAPVRTRHADPRVARLFSYCRPDTWEKGTLVVQGTRGTERLTGSFMSLGDVVRFRKGASGDDLGISVGRVIDIRFTRPGGRKVSAGDLLFKRGEHRKAAETYRQALADNPGHPYLRARIDECEEAAGRGSERAEGPAPRRPVPAPREVAAAPSGTAPRPGSSAKWDRRLLARVREEVASGRRPEFRFASADRKARVDSVDPDGTLGMEAGGIGTSVWLPDLTAEDKRNLALAVLREGTPSDHAVAAFYLFAAGDAARAEVHLGKAGREAGEVRSSFE
jgi:serine/threonine-protein kinase